MLRGRTGESSSAATLTTATTPASSRRLGSRPSPALPIHSLPGRISRMDHFAPAAASPPSASPVQTRVAAWTARSPTRTAQFIRQIAKFSTLAKANQPRYGSIRIPAARDLHQNARVVAAMAVSRTRISRNAAPGRWNQKKIHDHAALTPTERQTASAVFVAHPAAKQATRPAARLHGPAKSSSPATRRCASTVRTSNGLIGIGGMPNFASTRSVMALGSAESAAASMTTLWTCRT